MFVFMFVLVCIYDQIWLKRTSHSDNVREKSLPSINCGID